MEENTLYMKWCLQCHRAPQNEIRPREEVFDMKWAKPASQEELGARLVAKYHVQIAHTENCSVCHR